MKLLTLILIIAFVAVTSFRPIRFGGSRFVNLKSSKAVRNPLFAKFNFATDLSYQSKWSIPAIKSSEIPNALTIARIASVPVMIATFTLNMV